MIYHLQYIKSTYIILYLLVSVLTAVRFLDIIRLRRFIIFFHNSSFSYYLDVSNQRTRFIILFIYLTRYKHRQNLAVTWDHQVDRPIEIVPFRKPWFRLVVRLRFSQVVVVAFGLGRRRRWFCLNWLTQRRKLDSDWRTPNIPWLGVEANLPPRFVDKDIAVRKPMHPA